MKRFAFVSTTITALAIGVAAFAMIASPLTVSAHSSAAAPHAMGIRNASGHSKSSGSYLKYQGGSVETTPVVYIDYWGSPWSTGFSTGGYTSAQAQTYVNDFFGNVGGSSWDNTNTQYCQGVASGTINCGTSGTHITNPAAQLAGTWNDTTNALTCNPTQSQIAAEAVKAMSHFGAYNRNATYFVFTPTGCSMSGFATSWCAWHSDTTSGGNTVAYAYMPYIPDAASSCGMNYVNSTNDSFGNGYFDGFSIVGGHEYAEAMTDPHPSSGAYGWITSTSRGSEIGDLCAWNSNGGVSGNVTLGSNHYAVQPLWSNATTTSSGSHCVMSY